MYWLFRILNLKRRIHLVHIKLQLIVNVITDTYVFHGITMIVLNDEMIKTVASVLSNYYDRNR